MLRLLAAAIAALIILALPALAGDRASLNIIGYSEDGRYFAFEELGEFDGVGGYYAHIFVVDLSDDSWVKGTPYSFEETDDSADSLGLAAIHTKLMADAAPMFRELRIGFPVD